MAIGEHYGHPGIPTTSTRRRGEPFTTPGLLGALATMTPGPPPPPPPTTMLPTMAQPGNRFGSSQAFQQGLTNQRALRQFKAGTYANNLPRDQMSAERAAGMNAYAQTNLAAADMATGGMFEQRGLVADANRRENAESGAKVNLAKSESSVNYARGQVGIPAEAKLHTAQAGAANFGVERGRAMLPGEVEGAGILNRGNSLLLPTLPNQAQANVNKTSAEAQAAGAGVGLVKQYQDQLKQAQQRISQLESHLSSYQNHSGTAFDKLMGATASPAAPTPVPTQAVPAPSPTPIPAQSGAPSQQDLEFTAQKYGITVDEVKRRLGQ